jgi:5-methylcytosine-specific restriction endonuclease McrA
MPRKNPEDIRTYQLKRYYRRKQDAIVYLGEKCAVCGSIQNLQFDHINPAEKSYTITKKITSSNWNDLCKELDKCQLLCISCHQQKTNTFLKKHASLNKKTKKLHGSYYGVYTLKCDCDLCSSYRTDRNLKRRK